MPERAFFYENNKKNELKVFFLFLNKKKLCIY